MPARPIAWGEPPVAEPSQTLIAMPELPEVETVRRGLEPAMAGLRIVTVEQRRPDLRFPFPERFADRMRGAQVTRIGRRAKYLLVSLSTGEVLVMHMGMSGRFTVTAASPPPSRTTPMPGYSRQTGAEPPTPRPDPSLLGKYTYTTGNDPAHDHVVLHLSNGAVVTYNDPRRFGFMLLLDEETMDAHRLFADLGAEPLGNALTPAYLAHRAAGRTTDLKAFLMDQRNVAGLGNIYVAEALYRAGLSPNRAANCLADRRGGPTARAERLAPAIRSVLHDAIEAGGSSLRDYRHADGTLGDFQHAFGVYGRAGEPCRTPGCRGTVRRLVQAGRSTFYCGGCQR